MISGLETSFTCIANEQVSMTALVKIQSLLRDEDVHLLMAIMQLRVPSFYHCSG